MKACRFSLMTLSIIVAVSLSNFTDTSVLLCWALWERSVSSCKAVFNLTQQAGIFFESASFSRQLYAVLTVLIYLEIQWRFLEFSSMSLLMHKYPFNFSISLGFCYAQPGIWKSQLFERQNEVALNDILRQYFSIMPHASSKRAECEGCCKSG